MSSLDPSSFTDKETEAQGGKVTCSKWHSKEGLEMGSSSGLWNLHYIRSFPILAYNHP